MPPPMPLSATRLRSSSGSQLGSASSSANARPDRVARVLGRGAPAIAACTSATNARTVGVSRTYSLAHRLESDTLRALRRRPRPSVSLRPAPPDDGSTR